jgi:hypothetical protein
MAAMGSKGGKKARGEAKRRPAAHYAKMVANRNAGREIARKAKGQKEPALIGRVETILTISEPNLIYCLCGQPAAHNGKDNFLCCACWVALGNEPNPEHTDCMVSVAQMSE